MSKPIAPTSGPFDVCHCGDYRHQHDERGCKVCRSMPTPWSPRCDSFRLNASGPRFGFAQERCPGHQASDLDPKVCWRCGIHIDELRP